MRLPVWLLVPLLVLGGCATVPSSGPALEVRRLPADSVLPDPVDVRLIPPAPSAGQTPNEILTGFLLASASLDDDHALARQYLTTEAAAQWHADAGVVVYDNSGEVLPRVSGAVDGSELQLGLQQAAVIDPQGVYTVAPQARSFTFGLARQNDQWRLSSVPPGTLLSLGSLSRIYKPYSLFFVNRTGTRLVPDRVFLPATLPSPASTLVERLLRGPSELLAAAAHTAFPGGRLLRPVVLAGKTAEIALPRSAAMLPDDTRAQLAAQIAYTLRALPSVSSVRILAGEVPLEVPGAGSVVQVDDLTSFDPDSLPAGTLGFYAGPDGELVSTGDRVLSRGLSGLRAPAVSPDATMIAALTPGGPGLTALVSGASGSVLEVRVVAPRLTPPSYGQGIEGVLSYRDGVPRPGLVLVRSDGAVDPVPAAQLLPDGDVPGPVTQVQVSRDGARVAVVAGPPERGRLYVGLLAPAAEQKSSRQMLEVVGLRPVAPGLGAVTDVSWSDAQTLVAVGQVSKDSQPSAWRVLYDGSQGVQPLTTNGAVPETVAAAPGHPLLIGAQGQVWVVEDGTATPLGKGSDPTYPG